MNENYNKELYDKRNKLYKRPRHKYLTKSFSEPYFFSFLSVSHYSPSHFSRSLKQY